MLYLTVEKSTILLFVKPLLPIILSHRVFDTRHLSGKCLPFDTRAMGSS